MNKAGGEHFNSTAPTDHTRQWEQHRVGGSPENDQRREFQQRFYERGDKNAREVLGLDEDATAITMSLEQRSFMSMLSPENAVLLDKSAVRPSRLGAVSVHGLISMDGQCIYPFDHKLQNTVHQAVCKELAGQSSSVAEMVRYLQDDNAVIEQQYVKSRGMSYIAKYREEVDNYRDDIAAQFKGDLPHADMVKPLPLRRAISEQVVGEGKMSPEEAQAYCSFGARRDALVRQLSRSIYFKDDKSGKPRAHELPFEMVGNKMLNVEKRLALIAKIQYLSRECDDEAMQQVIAGRISKSQLPEGLDENQYLRRAIVDLKKVLIQGNKKIQSSNAKNARDSDPSDQSNNSKTSNPSVNEAEEESLTSEQYACLAQFIQLCKSYYGDLMPRLEEASFFYGAPDNRYVKLKVEERFGDSAQRRREGRRIAEERSRDELESIKLHVAQALSSDVTADNWRDTYILPTGILVWTADSRKFGVHGQSALSNLYHAQMPSEDAWLVWSRLWLPTTGWRNQYSDIARSTINRVVRHDISANIDNLNATDFDMYNFLYENDVEINNLLDEAGNFMDQPTTNNVDFLRAVMPYAGGFVRRINADQSMITIHGVKEHLSELRKFFKGQLPYYRQPANQLFYPINDKRNSDAAPGVGALCIRVGQLLASDFDGDDPESATNRSLLSEMVCDDLGMAIFDRLNVNQITHFRSLLHLPNSINVPVHDISRGYGYDRSRSYIPVNKRDRMIEMRTRLRPYFINEFAKYFAGHANQEMTKFIDGLKAHKSTKGER